MDSSVQATTGPVPMVLTYRKIAASVRKSGLIEAAEHDQLAAYVERACRRHDWNEERRRGELPAYEVALAMVMAFQGLLRRLDDRLPDGPLRETGFEPKQVYLEPVDASSFPVSRLEYREPETKLYKPPALLEEPGENEYIGDKEQRGFCLGNIVDPNDELSWYWGESALEVGYSSTYDAMVTKIASGGSQFVYQEPVGPNDRMISAARRQREVMQAMRAVPKRLQAVAETAYLDRRQRQQLVTTFGAGVAAIVARADHAKRELEQSPTGEAIRGLQRFLMALTGSTRRVPDWSPLVGIEDADGTSLESRKGKAASRLLRAAQDAYRKARGIGPRRPFKRREKSRWGKLVPVAVRSLSPRRQLIEVSRAA